MLAQEVANVEKQVSGKESTVDNFTILTLAALNIINEFVDLREDYADLRRNNSERSESLLRTINMET